jgi:hypothetical protein
VTILILCELLLKDSSINEKAKAAINTPLPNAIIEAITFFGKLTNNATI